MKRVQKGFTGLAIAAMLSGSVLVAVPTARAANYVLRFGDVQSISHVYNKGAVKLAQLVAKRSNGRLKIEIYPDSRLGTNPAMLDEIKTGMLAMGQFPPGTLGSYDKRISILSLYYLFNNFDAMKAALSSPAMKKLADLYREKTGIRVLGYFGGMERDIITRSKAINSLADLKGLKMRAWNWRPSVEWWKDLGAIPAVISYNEVYTALQTGVVDGAENDLSTFTKSKWVEICKHIALTQHVYTIRPVVINEGRFKKLPADLQKILVQAMAEASNYQLGLAQKLNVSLAKQIKANYKDIQFTKPNKAPFIKISRKLDLAYGKEVGAEDLVKQLIK